MAAFLRPKNIKGNSKRPKDVVIAVFYLVRTDRHLVISPHEISFGKNGAPGKAMGVVLYLWDWVSVRDSASSRGSVISTRPPTAVLGHEMEGG